MTGDAGSGLGRPFDLLSCLAQDSIMVDVWSERATIEGWLMVESALARAQAVRDVIGGADAAAITQACRFDAIDVGQLWLESRNVGYPILPLVRQIADQLPDGPAGMVHLGATTQDIMDTALALQLRSSCERLASLLVLFGDALSALQRQHHSTLMAARTHAQQAVPTTFGAKLAVYLNEVQTHLERVNRLGVQLARVSLFGAGGTSAALGAQSRQVRHEMADQLHLAAVDIPWHVARGGIAEFGSLLASISAAGTRLAREVVDLSRTEIAEIREEGGIHRGASSTMPQKTNPITCEAMIGLGVVVVQLSGALLRGMEAGHERAAGEWQIEWTVLPTLCVKTATVLSLAVGLISRLQVFPATMAKNLAADGGALMSEAVMMSLAREVGRGRAHDLVSAAAHESRASGVPLLETLPKFLPDGVALDSWTLDPTHYLGEAVKVSTEVQRRWTTMRAELGAG